MRGLLEPGSIVGDTAFVNGHKWLSLLDCFKAAVISRLLATFTNVSEAESMQTNALVEHITCRRVQARKPQHSYTNLLTLRT